MDSLKNLPNILFVTGIGTDVGKSWVTGWLARELTLTGRSVITQKFVQTGNVGYSEDIEVHRRIMGIEMTPSDLDHTTAPVIYSYPASPHLSAMIDERPLDISLIEKATEKLASQYDSLLIEGAGGLMVPLTERYLTIDYVRDHHLPVVLATGGRLGSISDTLLTLHALDTYGITLAAMVYNPYFDRDTTIATETRKYFAALLAERYPDALYLEMPTHII